jgi:hypothetical protein
MSVQTTTNHRNYVVFRIFYYGLEFEPPSFQCLALLFVVRMPIINGGYTALNVVQDFGDHQPGNAHAGHEAGGGAPQVVWYKAEPQGLQTRPSEGVVNSFRGNVFASEAENSRSKFTGAG